jgi:hypothetical protein
VTESGTDPKTGWNFPDDLLEAAWGIIANAGEGSWDRESPEWREAAIRWRDAYHAELPNMVDRDRQREASAAEAAARRAIGQAGRNADPLAYRWLARVFVTVIADAHNGTGSDGYSFTSETVWRAWADIDPNIRARLHDPRALGALLRLAAERRYIVSSGRHVTGKRPESHGRPVRVWKAGPNWHKASKLVEEAEARVTTEATS